MSFKSGEWKVEADRRYIGTVPRKIALPWDGGPLKEGQEILTMGYNLNEWYHRKSTEPVLVKLMTKLFEVTEYTNVVQFKVLFDNLKKLKEKKRKELAGLGRTETAIDIALYSLEEDWKAKEEYLIQDIIEEFSKRRAAKLKRLPWILLMGSDAVVLAELSELLPVSWYLSVPGKWGKTIDNSKFMHMLKYRFESEEVGDDYDLANEAAFLFWDMVNMPSFGSGRAGGNMLSLLNIRAKKKSPTVFSVHVPSSLLQKSDPGIEKYVRVTMTDAIGSAAASYIVDSSIGINLNSL